MPINRLHQSELSILEKQDIQLLTKEIPGNQWDFVLLESRNIECADFDMTITASYHMLHVITF